MSTPSIAQKLLQSASIAPEIFQLRPDYRALLLVVEGIPPGPSDAQSETLLQQAEAAAKQLLSKTPVTQIPHIAAWRDAYKAFGAKPQKTRHSLEQLTRRAEGGLPRVNRLTDIYNAISVKHQVPIGGEDLDKYQGSPFLIRASGKEEFKTMSAGQEQVEAPEVGEPIWCDEGGITCRRWNWRQCARTGLSDQTTRVLFILDALEGLSDDALAQAAEELGSALKELSPEVHTAQRIITGPNAA